MKKEHMLAWIQWFKAAREVEQDLARKEPVDSAGSVAIGLSLTEFARRCGGGSAGVTGSETTMSGSSESAGEIAAGVPVVSTARDFSSAIRALMTVLDGGLPGMIIGGVAVIALGFPRTTVDIDATVWATLDDLDSYGAA